MHSVNLHSRGPEIWHFPFNPDQSYFLVIDPHAILFMQCIGIICLSASIISSIVQGRVLIYITLYNSKTL